MEQPRRIRVDKMTPAELAIREAMLAVEAVGADERLTAAVNLLSQARNHVADFVDGVPFRKDFRTRLHELIDSVDD